jgi:hypothetical protein
MGKLLAASQLSELYNLFVIHMVYQRRYGNDDRLFNTPFTSRMKEQVSYRLQSMRSILI